MVIGFSATWFLSPLRLEVAAQDVDSPATLTESVNTVVNLSEEDIAQFVERHRKNGLNELAFEIESSESLIEHLELSQEQVSDIRKLKATVTEKAQLLLDSFKQKKAFDTSDVDTIAKDKKELSAELNKLSRELGDKITNEVLVPAQVEQLRTIAEQKLFQTLKHYTHGKASQEAVLAVYLQLSNEELRKLRSTVASCNEELKEVVEKQKAKLIKEIEDSLPTKKLKLLQEVTNGDADQYFKLLLKDF